MAKLVINKTTNDSTGGTVASNAIIGFDTTFIWGTLEVHYNLKTYRSQADYEAGKSPIFITQIPNYGMVKVMTEEQYSALNSNINALLTVATWLKEKLIATGNFTDSDLTISA